jgi:hypothetical protein
MKAERIELAALAAVSGPRATAQEIATYAYLAEFAAVCEQIAAIPVDDRIERVQAVRNLCVRPADAEAVRAAFWVRMPLGVRTVAIMSAGLHKARAEDTLNKFNAYERGLVWVAMSKLIADLQTVQKCMNGGNSTPPNEIDRKAVMNGYPAEVKRTH